MQPEIYFLRYAFPCARVLLDIRKTITQQDYKIIENAVEKDIPLERPYLERIFPRAFIGLKKISEDYWNVETIREYFWNRHEENISADLPQMVRRLCAVEKGRLVRQVGRHFVADLGGDDIRTVVALYQNARPGDIVMVHYGYAVEAVNS